VNPAARGGAAATAAAARTAELGKPGGAGIPAVSTLAPLAALATVTDHCIRGGASRRPGRSAVTAGASDAARAAESNAATITTPAAGAAQAPDGLIRLKARSRQRSSSSRKNQPAARGRTSGASLPSRAGGAPPPRCPGGAPAPASATTAAVESIDLGGGPADDPVGAATAKSAATTAAAKTSRPSNTAAAALASGAGRTAYRFITFECVDRKGKPQ
jgi:hypothetical protein